MTTPGELNELVDRFDRHKAKEGQIEATDRQINKLVYELYGLTAEEIKIVEEQG
ncbi:hypothetical protein ACFLXQ_07005 [Chloroflexota bacterium]